MINLSAERRHLKGVEFLLQMYGLYILYYSLMDINTSDFYKYGLAMFFIVDKLWALKRVISNPNLEYLFDQLFYLDLSLFKKKYNKRLYFTGVYLLFSFFFTLYEYLGNENTQQIYKIYLWSCLFGFYLFFYQDWIGAVDAVIVQYMVLSMWMVFREKFDIKEVSITIGCECFMIFFTMYVAFDQRENRGQVPIKEVAGGLFLSMVLGITLPFNLNKREYILKDKIFKILAQTQAFFSFHIIFTFKFLFYTYSPFTRVLMLAYIPLFIYRILRQINFFTSGPYSTTLEIDCNNYNKIFRQISDEILHTRVTFTHFSCNWACDQMEFLHKINQNMLFTYELHHGALVSEVNFEVHNGNNVISTQTNNLSVLIFALYIYSINNIYPNLRFHFDISKFKQTPQHQLDFYLIRYPFANFYSKQLNYDDQEVPMKLSPLVRTYQREVQQQLKSLILFERHLKPFLNQTRFQIFSELNE